MYVCYEDIRSSGLELHTDSCELPYELWEMNPGPLEEQTVLFTAEQSLQPLLFKTIFYVQWCEGVRSPRDWIYTHL